MLMIGAWSITITRVWSYIEFTAIPGIHKRDVTKTLLSIVRYIGTYISDIDGKGISRTFEILGSSRGREVY